MRFAIGFLIWIVVGLAAGFLVARPFPAAGPPPAPSLG
jgi:hypothetical protein